jgi:lipoprotein-releasing system permease protein
LNTEFFIAKRYLFSKEKKNFIHIITLISVLGVATATMALVVILSVFNGLEDLLRNVFRSFDPDLKVMPIKGKSFYLDNDLIGRLRSIEDIKAVHPILEDNALIKYENSQLVVKFKGVPDNYFTENQLDSILVEGKLEIKKDTIPFAVLGRGVQFFLNVNLKNEFIPLQFWYPKLQQKQIIDPEKAFNRLIVLPKGVFAVEKQFDDNYVFLPIAEAIALMDYGNKRSYMEIKGRENADMASLKEKAQEILGDKFVVLNQDEQHATLLKAIKVEKSFVFITFIVIIAVAALNILFSLTLTAIEKKQDVSLLKALGASDSFLKKIFLLQGFLIGFIGTALGLGLGWGICLLQQKYGFISMGIESSLVDAYPVRIQWSDFFLVGTAVFLITLVFALKPALEATKQKIEEI